MRLVLLTAAALALAPPLSPLANASEAAAAPDLAARLFVEPAFWDPSVVRFGVAVVNVGDAPAGAFQVRLDFEGEVLVDLRVAGLAPGERNVTFGSRERADGRLSLLADALGEVAEPDESNNAASFVIASHDLAASVRVEGVPGKVLTQRAVVTACNVAGPAVEHARASVSLQADAGGSRFLGTLPFPPIAPGACGEASLLLRNPAAGSYRVHAGVASQWDANPANDRATARAYALADPGVGVLAPTGLVDV